VTVDIWIRDYNPPRFFQKKISGRGKHSGTPYISVELLTLARYDLISLFSHPVYHDKNELLFVKAVRIIIIVIVL
jgi:hypothetical protein